MATSKKRSIGKTLLPVKTKRLYDTGAKKIPVYSFTQKTHIDVARYIPLPGSKNTRASNDVLRLQDLFPKGTPENVQLSLRNNIGRRFIEEFTPQYGYGERSNFGRFRFAGSQLYLTDYDRWVLKATNDFESSFIVLIDCAGLSSPFAKVYFHEITVPDGGKCVLRIFTEGPQLYFDVTMLSNSFFSVVLDTTTPFAQMYFQLTIIDNEALPITCPIRKIELYDSLFAFPVIPDRMLTL